VLIFWRVGIKPVPTKPSVCQYWWPSVNSVKFMYDRMCSAHYIVVSLTCSDCHVDVSPECVKVRMLLRELEEARGTVVRMTQEDDGMEVSSSSGIITSQLVTFK